MITVIKGVEVKLPKKLESRMDEVAELVDMVIELSNRKNKTVNKIHVWETKRHELCYSDFTEKPVPKPDMSVTVHLPKSRTGSGGKIDLLYVCDECLCKKCVLKGRKCLPCSSCGNVPKVTGCPYGRMFDPRIMETAQILPRKKDCLSLKVNGQCNPDICNQCELNVSDEDMLKAVTKAQTILDNVHHYVVVERFEDKLVRETTVDLYYPEK